MLPDNPIPLPLPPLNPGQQPPYPEQPLGGIPQPQFFTKVPGPARSRSVDPVLSYQFSVELTEDPFGILGFKIPIKGYFSEISGLEVEWETAEYKSTNILGFPHSNHVPMRPVYKQLTLKRGITDSEGFWLWHQLLALGAKPLLKCYVMITMYNRSYEPIVQWSVERAWPSRISGPTIASDSNDFAIEEMTLTHGGVMRMYLNPFFMGIDVAMQLLLP